MTDGVPPSDTQCAAFISYASPDVAKAEEILRYLEERDLRCWIAPRDVMPGAEYGNEIIRGIEGSRCLVLVLSQAANESKFVRREVERAVSKGKLIIPFRIESILPSPQLELFVSSTQWIDAWNAQMVAGLRRLSATLSDERAGVASPSGSGAGRTRSRRVVPIATGAGVAAAVAVGALVWHPWRDRPAATEQPAPAASATPTPDPAALAAGTWDGTMNCGGKVGVRMAIRNDRPGRVAGYVYSYTTTGGRRVQAQCYALLGTFDGKRSEMSVRAQTAGQPQSLTNVDGYRGLILNGAVSQDRFAGQVDYIGSCTSFVLMRSAPEPMKIPACAKTLPPNSYVGMPSAQLEAIIATAMKRMQALNAGWGKVAARPDKMDACTDRSIETWAAQGYRGMTAQWVAAHPLPKSAAEQSIWQLNLAAQLTGLSEYPVDQWKALPCGAAMERRVVAMSHEAGTEMSKVADASRALAGMP